MKRLLLFLAAFAGSSAVAFLLLVSMAWVATSVTPAYGQGVVERSRSTQSTDERARQNARQESKTDRQSASRTYTVSQLFFRQLADLDRARGRAASAESTGVSCRR